MFGKIFKTVFVCIFGSPTDRSFLGRLLSWFFPNVVVDQRQGGGEKEPKGAKEMKEKEDKVAEVLRPDTPEDSDEGFEVVKRKHRADVIAKAQKQKESLGSQSDFKTATKGNRVRLWGQSEDTIREYKKLLGGIEGRPDKFHWEIQNVKFPEERVDLGRGMVPARGYALLSALTKSQVSPDDFFKFDSPGTMILDNVIALRAINNCCKEGMDKNAPLQIGGAYYVVIKEDCSCKNDNRPRCFRIVRSREYVIRPEFTFIWGGFPPKKINAGSTSQTKPNDRSDSDKSKDNKEDDGPSSKSPSSSRPTSSIRGRARRGGLVGTGGSFKSFQQAQLEGNPVPLVEQQKNDNKNEVLPTWSIVSKPGLKTTLSCFTLRHTLGGTLNFYLIPREDRVNTQVLRKKGTKEQLAKILSERPKFEISGPFLMDAPYGQHY